MAVGFNYSEDVMAGCWVSPILPFTLTLIDCCVSLFDRNAGGGICYCAAKTNNRREVMIALWSGGGRQQAVLMLNVGLRLQLIRSGDGGNGC